MAAARSAWGGSIPPAVRPGRRSAHTRTRDGDHGAGPRASLLLRRALRPYCAPTFVFLAGASAWIAGTRRTRGELTRFLLSRGLWLIVLELTVITFAWYLTTAWTLGAVAQVIWAIGWSMIAPVVMSFSNVTKYPPSLLYLLMTLGPALLALAWLRRARGPLAELLVTFGRVPFLFYVAHLFLVHALAVGTGVLQGFPDSAMRTVFRELPGGYGFGLPVVYLVWLARSRAWWLSS